jgi:D-threo-aldose 1-dehydrogenase
VIERFGYGAASIGNLYRAIDDATAEDVLEAVWDSGIRYFDTAPHYGLGLSERRLGAFLRGKPRGEYRLSTKVGRILEPAPDFHGETDAEGFAVPAEHVRRFDPTPAGIERSLADSLQRLGLDRVDTLLLHDPDAYDLDAGLRLGLPALVSLREQGVASEVGIGVNSVDAALRAVREYDIDVVMIAGRYTLLEQGAADELLPEAAARGMRVIAAAVFNSGILAADEPAQGHYNYGTAPRHIVEAAARLRAVCEEFGVALPAAALQFPLRHPAVDTVVAGAGRAGEARANAAHMAAEIPEEFWAELSRAGLIP